MLLSFESWCGKAGSLDIFLERKSLTPSAQSHDCCHNTKTHILHWEKYINRPFSKKGDQRYLCKDDQEAITFLKLKGTLKK